MSKITLIMGKSGTGKSTSIRNLDPSETYIINSIDKFLPFPNSKQKYIQKEGGNYFASKDAGSIVKVLRGISQKRPEIKVIIIDDFQYIMSYEFMRRAKEKSFDKFIDIAYNAWLIIEEAQKLREDLFVFILSHTAADEDGNINIKTIGKMTDNYIDLQGIFTCIFHSLVIDGKYVFLTHNNGKHVARNPMGLFEDDLIDNDLEKIKNRMSEFFGNEKINDLSEIIRNASIVDQSIIDNLSVTIHPSELKEIPYFDQH